MISSKFSASSCCRLNNEVNVNNNNNNYKLAADYVNRDLKNMHADIRKLFTTNKPELKQICDGTFTNMKQLERIDLRNNDINPTNSKDEKEFVNKHYLKKSLTFGCINWVNPFMFQK